MSSQNSRSACSDPRTARCGGTGARHHLPYSTSETDSSSCSCTPARASLCLPTRPWRLIWGITALALGTAAGLLFQHAFAEPAQAVGIAVTTTEIALHLGELAMEVTPLVRATPTPPVS